MSSIAHIKPADRIASFQPYFFATLNTKITALKAQNKDVIRLDMGSPDLPPAEHIISALTRAAQRPDTHGYSPNGGTLAYKQAVADYYMNRFEVELNPNTEVLGLIGSKEGLFNLNQVLVNPGDYVLVPDPGYPVYEAGALIAGGQVYKVPLLSSNHFLPDLSAIPSDIASKAKILWLNYPNNPTGAIAPLAFLEEAIEFARQYGVIIGHDCPYVDICFDGYRAPSIMQLHGAKEVAVELNSLSKTYNMAGWRLGMAVGNPEVLRYLHTYKSQMDTSHFGPVYEAGIAALTGDQDWLEGRNAVYQERRDVVVSALRSAGFQVELPPASIYVWARLPENAGDSVTFCREMLDDVYVSTTPGTVYGDYGEGYLRISLVTDTARVREAMQRLVDWVRQRG
ncbi:MAG: aminotransferase class I/II-fold pyridoxal phosphate-dependent enzyme [Chloroflexi bacterium]|jgi:LL-diaminopimelate aminotransferase|nr:aminotransferase class I/II-fold pyridoxal phosphate-dependent enzyme [Anaerolineaceae bacterium]NMB88936.1 aminotransferase class I/II-fold pyridoxal phosphate-dependent enzyme [Chloroflexota bacterium]